MFHVELPSDIIKNLNPPISLFYATYVMNKDEYI